MPKKQPKTPEELQQDIEQHPERGLIDGEEIVRFDSVEIRGTVPRELHRLVLEAGGALGYNKSEIIRAALEDWVTKHLATVVRSQEVKAAKYDVEEIEIRSKVFGAYKAAGRKAKARLKKD